MRFLNGDSSADTGDYFINFAKMIKNRMIDLYDDVLLLLERERIPSACVISRCMMETHAVGTYFCAEVDSAFEKDGIKGAEKTVLRFINSSRMKVDEQKRLKKGTYSLDDYLITDQARHRLENELAESSHIANAMKYFFEKNRESVGAAESPYGLVYAALCEWTHPSQTSLFHAYAKEAQSVKTSMGTTTVLEGGRHSCAHAMSFITATEGLFQHMLEAGKHLSSEASAKPRSAPRK